MPTDRGPGTSPDRHATGKDHGDGRSDLVDTLYREERASATLAVRFHAALAARVGINVTDVTCLAVLDKEGPRTARQLAEAMGLSRGGAITALLDRLEQAGFVQRRRDAEDRRRVLVELAPDGKYRALQGLLEDFGGDYRALLAEYDDAQLALVLDFSRRANEVVSRHIARLAEGRGHDA